MDYPLPEVTLVRKSRYKWQAIPLRNYNKPYSNTPNLNHNHLVAGVFLHEVEEPSSWLDVAGIHNEFYYCFDKQALDFK